MGANLGYTGKQVIHPAQVPVVQDAFLPSPDTVLYAARIIDEDARAQVGLVSPFIFYFFFFFLSLSRLQISFRSCCFET